MTVYLDVTKEKGCVGVVLKQDVQVVYTGTELHREPAKYRDLARPFEDNDFHFWFGDEKPEVSLYTVPKTVICGYDSRGGCFASIDSLPFHEQQPMYYISPDLQCWLITDDAREFREPFPDWREKLTLSDAIDVYPSREEAEKKYEIKELKDLWEEDL